MKKTALLTSLLTGLILCALPVSADDTDYTYNGNTYYLDGDERVAMVTNPSTNGIIPSHISYKGKRYKVARIGDAAFLGCATLRQLTIPATVTGIGEMSFGNCTGLKNVFIPATVTDIGRGPFAGCSSLASIKVSKNSKDFTGINGALYTKNKSELIQCPGAASTITVPPTVTDVRELAFRDCINLKKIVLQSIVPPKTDVYSFDTDLYDRVELEVPNYSKALYTRIEPWKSFAQVTGTGDMSMTIPFADAVLTKRTDSTGYGLSGELYFGLYDYGSSLLYDYDSRFLYISARNDNDNFIIRIPHNTQKGCNIKLRTHYSAEGTTFEFTVRDPGEDIYSVTNLHQGKPIEVNKYVNDLLWETLEIPYSDEIFNYAFEFMRAMAYYYMDFDVLDKK